jgi:ABC-type transport system substrate-binding protein
MPFPSMSLAQALAAALVFVLAQLAQAAAPPKVLRVAYLIAETNFDPAAVSDLYSHNIIEEIFEPPLTYDFLARPAKLKPATLEAMPEITDNGRTYTLKLRKGIYFSDDPAVRGTQARARRERLRVRDSSG